MKSIALILGASALLGGLVTMGTIGDSKDLWQEYRRLVGKGTGQGNSELELFLKSLSPEEMLIAARQGCEDAARFELEFERAAACGSAVVGVLVFYFDNSPSEEEGAARLLAIMADDTDSPWVRQAVIGCLTLSEGVEFGNIFRRYALDHIDKMDGIMANIVEDRRQIMSLRYQAIHASASLLGSLGSSAWQKDPQVRAESERTRKGVPVGELWRQGKLELAPETLAELRPIEERVRSKAALLGRIVTDNGEPVALRKHALRMLEGFSRMPLQNPEPIDRAVEEGKRLGVEKMKGEP